MAEGIVVAERSYQGLVESVKGKWSDSRPTGAHRFAFHFARCPIRHCFGLARRQNLWRSIHPIDTPVSFCLAVGSKLKFGHIFPTRV